MTRLSCGIAIAAALLVAVAVPLGAQTKALRFAMLVDGNGQVLRDAVVVVDSDRVTSVGSGNGAVPAGAQVIDLRRYTAIPGMIDAHTHMTYYWDQRPGTKPLAQPRRLAQVTVFLAQENARKTLETGVTTVRDLGSSEYNDIAMRELINRGAMVGPRMFVVGYGLSHPRTPPRAGAPPGAPRGQVSDTAEIAVAVKAQVDAGADWIKMYGSTGTYADTSTRQTFTYEEMKAAVDAAHRLGKKIAIHSYGASGGRDAMRAGAESVEHAVDLDDATLTEMVSRGTWYVPTIDHNRFYAENAIPFGFTSDQAKGLDEFRAPFRETARRAFKAGVKFAMGSDAVYTMFGQNTRELRWFVKLGMTPAQALATATTEARRCSGWKTASAESRPAITPTSSPSRAIRSPISTWSSTTSAG